MMKWDEEMAVPVAHQYDLSNSVRGQFVPDAPGESDRLPLGKTSGGCGGDNRRLSNCFPFYRTLKH